VAQTKLQRGPGRCGRAGSTQDRCDEERDGEERSLSPRRHPSSLPIQAERRLKIF